jgi:insulysin
MITINKPIYEKRIMKGSTLANKIKYVTIHDPLLEMSYVSVCVNVGSYANPKKYDGLAHFLEHMLFMGSKKYPDEDYYNNRLNELGGSSNAYTDIMRTVYYFNVFNNNLEEIIDIFSQFFIDPLFKADAINREMNAVDNEHKKNIYNEAWRKYNLMLHLANKKSSVNTFSTGSLETLSHDDIRDVMIDFYNKYYISENISICIASSKSIEDMIKIIEHTFSKIPNKKGNQFILSKPFYTENTKKIYFHKTLTDIYELTYIFEIPLNCTDEFTIIKLILTNISKNSLYFNLKNLGLINIIDIDITEDGIFKITIIMTKNGLSHIKNINNILLSYIMKIINNTNIEKYAKYYKKLLDINWDYMDKVDAGSLCNIFAENLHKINVSIKEVYQYDHIIKKIKSNDEYSALYKKYININNMITIISCQKYNTINNMSKTPYYDTEYSELSSLLFQIELYNNINIINSLTNNYMKIKPSLIHNLDKYKIPSNLLLYNKLNIWYGGCSEFSELMIYSLFQFNNIEYFNTPLNYLLTILSCNILNFLVSTILYKSMQVNYNIFFESKPIISSINININGLNDNKKIKLLIKQLFIIIQNIDVYLKKINDEYINNLIKSTILAYMNTDFLNPSEYSAYIIKSKLYHTEYETKILLEKLKMIDPKMIRKYIHNIFNSKKVSLNSVIYGNILPSMIKKSFQKIYDIYNTSLEFSYPPINKIINYSTSHPNMKEKSCCVTYYYYIGSFIPSTIILLLITNQILGQEFFNILRTKQQLGYLVNMYIMNIRNNYYIVQKVQSDKSVAIVEDNIIIFNNMISDIINNCNLAKIIETIKAELMEPDYSISDRINRYFPEILNREYIFNRNELLLKELKEININMIITFAKKYINNENIAKVIINGN